MTNAERLPPLRTPLCPAGHLPLKREIKPAVLSSPLFGALTIGGSGDDRRSLLTIRVLRLLGNSKSSQTDRRSLIASMKASVRDRKHDSDKARSACLRPMRRAPMRFYGALLRRFAAFRSANGANFRNS